MPLLEPKIVFIVECDYCGNTEENEIEYPDWDLVIDVIDGRKENFIKELKKDGWTFPDGEDGEAFCPDCKEERLEEEAEQKDLEIRQEM